MRWEAIESIRFLILAGSIATSTCCLYLIMRCFVSVGAEMRAELGSARLSEDRLMNTEIPKHAPGRVFQRVPVR